MSWCLLFTDDAAQKGQKIEVISSHDPPHPCIYLSTRTVLTTEVID